MTINRTAFLAGIALAVLIPESAIAEGSRNFGKDRLAVEKIEPTAGEASEPSGGLTFESEGGVGEALATVPTPEPSTSTETQSALPPSVLAPGCGEGLPELGTAPLAFFHEAQQAEWGRNGDEYFLDKMTGRAFYNGQIYLLKAASLTVREFVPMSGASYPARVRLDYVAEDQSHVTVDVPVREGAASLAVEKIITGKPVPVDPGALLPDDKAYAVFAPCQRLGAAMNDIVMTTPIEISSAQLERLRSPATP